MPTTPPAPSHPPGLSVLGAFLHRDRAHPARLSGQGLVEYSLILVLIAIVSIGALSMVGQNTSSVFEQINCYLGDGKVHTDNGNGKSTKCKS